jgi:imidazolonepropionase-like amidohydrolase
LRIWDGRGEGYLDAADAIRIEGRRITAVGRGRELSSGAEVRELDGATALPGLIDAHVHLTLDPEVGSVAEQLERPQGEIVQQMQVRATAMLRAGITTARDLGGGAWLELELRDRIAQGACLGPRLLCAGQPVTSPRGHCHFWGGEASDEAGMRSVVQRQVEHGADWIKVMATGGVLTRGSSSRQPQFDAEQLGFVVDEAQRHGRRVAAHCHATSGIRSAAEAGVATIEHCSWAGDEGFGSDLDPDVVGLIAERGSWVSPTVNAGWRRFLDGGERGQRFADGMRQCFRELRRAGVRLVASTDAGIPNVRHDGLPAALQVFAELAELSPVETLRAATSDAALALGIAEVTGALEPGLEADLLVSDGDPLSDLAALERPLAVMAAGRAALGTP